MVVRKACAGVVAVAVAVSVPVFGVSSAGAVEGGGVVSPAPYLVERFLDDAVKDPSRLVASDVDLFVEELDGFLSSADGSGEEIVTYTYGDDMSFGFRKEWTSKDKVTHLTAWSGDSVQEEAFFTPAGKYSRVFRASEGDRWATPREMYPLRKSVQVDWAHESTYDTSCRVYCAWVGNSMYGEEEGKLQPIEAARASDGTVTLKLKFEKLLLTITANTATGVYSAVSTPEFSSAGEQVTTRTDAVMVSPDAAIVVPTKNVAPERVYRKAWALDACASTWFSDVSKTGYDDPSVADLKRNAGKKLSFTDNPCSFTIPKAAGRDGMWLVKVTSKGYKSYGLKTGAFYYRPAKGGGAGYAESPEYRR